MRWVVALTAAAVAAALAVGCGPSGSNSSGGGGGPAGGAGGEGPGGGGPGAGGGGGIQTNRGFARLFQGPNYRLAVAAFYPDGLPGVAIPATYTGCIATVNGSCTITDCTNDGGTTPEIDAGRRVGAGNMIAKVNSESLTLVRATSGVGAGTYNVSDNARWWHGGEMATVTATGDDAGVPSFTSALIAPTQLDLTVANDGGSLTVTRGTAFNVTWTAGTGDAIISLESGGSEDRNRYGALHCKCLRRHVHGAGRCDQFTGFRAGLSLGRESHFNDNDRRQLVD